MAQSQLNIFQVIQYWQGTEKNRRFCANEGRLTNNNGNNFMQKGSPSNQPVFFSEN